jgi:transketolase
VLYDANLTTLSAATNITFSQDLAARFEAYGWHVQRIDGQDSGAVDAALTADRAVEDRPSLIVRRTLIGYGSPHRQDTWHAHGEPLGVEEVRLTKHALGWPEEDRTFDVPDEALREFRKSIERGAELEASWQRRPDDYRGAHLDLAQRFAETLAGELPQVGGTPSGFHARGWRAGHPRRGGQGDQSAGCDCAESGRRIGRSRSVDAHRNEWMPRLRVFVSR